MLYMVINVMTATCVCISTNRVLGYSIIAMTYHYVNNIIIPQVLQRINSIVA